MNTKTQNKHYLNCSNIDNKKQHSKYYAKWYTKHCFYFLNSHKRSARLKHFSSDEHLLLHLFTKRDSLCPSFVFFTSSTAGKMVFSSWTWEMTPIMRPDFCKSINVSIDL